MKNDLKKVFEIMRQVLIRITFVITACVMTNTQIHSRTLAHKQGDRYNIKNASWMSKT